MLQDWFYKNRSKLTGCWFFGNEPNTMPPEDFDKALRVTQIMNKLCYIEVCTDKLDVPQLTWGFVNSVKSKNPYTNIAENSKIFNDIFTK